MCPQWTEFDTADPDFNVSWLLGLIPRHGDYGSVATCPPQWAEEFVTKDPNFNVSHILGLIPGPETPTEGDDEQSDGVENEEAADEDSEQSEQEGVEEEESVDEMGLQRLFGDIPYDEGESEEEKSDDEAQVDYDPPVLATPDFLDLCEKMEDMILEIE